MPQDASQESQNASQTIDIAAQQQGQQAKDGGLPETVGKLLPGNPSMAAESTERQDGGGTLLKEVKDTRVGVEEARIESWFGQFGQTEFFGNTLGQWITSGIVFAIVLVLLPILKRVIVAWAQRLAKRTTSRWDDFVVRLLNRTKGWVIFVVAVAVGAYALSLPDKIATLIRVIVLVSLAAQAAMWGSALLQEWLDQLERRRQEREADSTVSTSAAYNALNFIGRVVIWAIALLVALSTLGIDITSVVAGLGIGGIAIALAVQNILGDLLCSISIALDKPFENGDFIIVGDKLGTVEKVGIKTTRVRSLSGEQLVFPNSDLVGSRIHNYKRMNERRIVFSFGVYYSTPVDTLAKISQACKEIIDNIEGVRFDRAHFKSFGASSLDFEVVYYVLSPDYNVYMDKQQEINLALVKRIGELGTGFAFPTRTVYLAKEDNAGDNDTVQRRTVGPATSESRLLGGREDVK